MSQLKLENRGLEKKASSTDVAHIEEIVLLNQERSKLLQQIVDLSSKLEASQKTIK